MNTICKNGDCFCDDTIPKFCEDNECNDYKSLSEEREAWEESYHQSEARIDKIMHERNIMRELLVKVRLKIETIQYAPWFEDSDIQASDFDYILDEIDAALSEVKE